MARELNRSQFSPFDRDALRRAQAEGGGVQLPMFAPAGEIRDAVLEGRMTSVDIPPSMTQHDWAAEKLKPLNDPRADYLHQGVRDPITMFAPDKPWSFYQGQEPTKPGDVLLGDGNHRVASVGYHKPDELVPVIWDSKDFMAGSIRHQRYR